MGLCTDYARVLEMAPLGRLNFSEIGSPQPSLEPNLRNGTPEQCWCDHVHKLILQMLHNALHEVNSAVPVFRKRPRDALASRPGGVYRTE